MTLLGIEPCVGNPCPPAPSPGPHARSHRLRREGFPSQLHGLGGHRRDQVRARASHGMAWLGNALLRPGPHGRSFVGRSNDMATAMVPPVAAANVAAAVAAEMAAGRRAAQAVGPAPGVPSAAAHVSLQHGGQAVCATDSDDYTGAWATTAARPQPPHPAALTPAPPASLPAEAMATDGPGPNDDAPSPRSGPRVSKKSGIFSRILSFRSSVRGHRGVYTRRPLCLPCPWLPDCDHLRFRSRAESRRGLRCAVEQPPPCGPLPDNTASCERRRDAGG